MTTKLNKEETGGLIIPAEDQNFATRLYHSNIIKDVIIHMSHTQNVWLISVVNLSIKSHLSAQNKPRLNRFTSTMI